MQLFFYLTKFLPLLDVDLSSPAKYIEKIYGGAAFEGIQEFIDLNSEMYGGKTADGYSRMLSALSKPYSVIAAVGICLMLIFFAANLIDGMTKERMSPEIFVRSVVSLIVGVVLATSGFSLMVKISDLGSDLSGLIQESLTDPTPGQDEDPANTPVGNAWNEFYGEGMGWAPCYTQKDAEKNVDDNANIKFINFSFNSTAEISKIELMLINSGVQLLKVFAYVILITRAVMIMVYMTLSPIALADIFRNGFMGSNGWRFMKKLFAYALQGGIIYMITYAGSFLNVYIMQSDLFKSAGTSIFMSLAVFFAELSLISKSLSAANDIVGTN